MLSRYFPASRLQQAIMNKTAVKRKKFPECDCEDASAVKKPRNFNDAKSKASGPNLSSLARNPNGAKSSSKLQQAFYDVPCIDLARNLLGQHIVRAMGNNEIRGRIVETESYIGPIDKAAHSYQGKKTPKNEAMFMTPGTCYVYNIYGMYCCMNISSQGDGAAVLIRAVEPLNGQSLMEEGRTGKAAKKKKPLKEKDLSNGPSKLCQAFHILKNEFNKADLTSSGSLWLERGDTVEENDIVSCPRINIGYADDWKEKPLRFYVLGNSCVSVRDKGAETRLQSAVSQATKS